MITWRLRQFSSALSVTVSFTRRLALGLRIKGFGYHPPQVMQVTCSDLGMRVWSRVAPAGVFRVSGFGMRV